MEWRLFADLAELADDRRVTVSVDGGDPTVGDALDALCATRPALSDRVREGEDLAPHVTCLRNGDPASLDDACADGDELALLPPATGG